MPNRIALAATLFALAIAAPASVSATAAEARPIFGLADNTIRTLEDPRFKQSGLKQVRILVPYDAVARGGKKRKELDTWFAIAKAQGLEPLVSWYRTYGCSPKCAAKRLPSVRSYVANVKRFRKRYPWVKRFSTWNEINFPAAQPTGRNPKRAAQFYLAHSKICAAGRCSVLTGDFRLNGSKFSANWLKTFKKTMGRRGRHTWGIVPHPEINAFHTRYTRQFLRSVRGNAWAVEAGAVNFFRPELRPSLSRQTRAMKFLMTKYASTSSRIKRIYMYHWQAAARQPKWDSALLNIDGTPRKAYFEFFKGLRRPAPMLPTP